MCTWLWGCAHKVLSGQSHARSPNAFFVLMASGCAAELAACLAAVELDYLLGRGAGWDQVQPWQETLSGGEKQRLAMARLLLHKPAYAILDECTSAVRARRSRGLAACDRCLILLWLCTRHAPGEEFPCAQCKICALVAYCGFCGSTRICYRLAFVWAEEFSCG